MMEVSSSLPQTQGEKQKVEHLWWRQIQRSFCGSMNVHKFIRWHISTCARLCKTLHTFSLRLYHYSALTNNFLWHAAKIYFKRQMWSQWSSNRMRLNRGTVQLRHEVRCLSNSSWWFAPLIMHLLKMFYAVLARSFSLCITPTSVR